jgi:hypothetical protein
LSLPSARSRTSEPRSLARRKHRAAARIIGSSAGNSPMAAGSPARIAAVTVHGRTAIVVVALRR